MGSTRHWSKRLTLLSGITHSSATYRSMGGGQSCVEGSRPLGPALSLALKTRAERDSDEPVPKQRASSGARAQSLTPHYE